MIGDKLVNNYLMKDVVIPLKKFLIFLITVLMLWYGVKYCKQFYVEHNYEKAIELICQGNYDGAIIALKKANGNFDAQEIQMELVHKLGVREFYRDTEELYTFCEAMSDYRKEDIEWFGAYCRIEEIPGSYKGDLFEEINAFKEEFYPLYNDYQTEKDIKERAFQAKKEAEFKKECETYKDKIPYVGMRERFINYTMMGEADEKNENYYYPLTKVESMMVTMYQWYSDEGGEMLKVLCKDGKVFEVTKQWQEFYWTEEGMPDFTGKKIVKKVNDTEERYDMERYSNEEDFYYDNYYDFFSYEDAERYYREHKK